MAFTIMRSRTLQGTQRNIALGSNSTGFSLLEVLLSTVIVTIALAGVANLFTSSLAISSRSDNQNAVETAVSTDLNWIKRYAKFWMMKSGPYALENNFTKTTSAFTSSPVLSYQCANSDLTASNLSTQFRTAAESITNTTDIDPKLSYTFSSSQTIPVPTTPYTLTRAVTSPTDTQILVKYTLTGADSASLAFKRETTILLESAAWCTANS
jgi:Tfp pilus assembly protein PilV